MQNHFCRIGFYLPAAFFRKCSAFMTVADIVDREKTLARLAWWALSVDEPAVFIGATADVVIRFATIGHVVARRLQ